MTKFCADLARAITSFLSKPEVAHAVLGAVQSADTLKRIEKLADSGKLGKVMLASKKAGQPRISQGRSPHPGAAGLRRRPMKSAYMEERFGPISFIVKVADTASAIALSERLVSTHGALTAGVYSTRPK
jgi:acyl-CoA reductase-like NAD-dependent aldehyde dehydrogenase